MLPDTLCCGCGPKRGCSLAELLLRSDRLIALEKHLEESYVCTVAGRGMSQEAKRKQRASRTPAVHASRLQAGLEETRAKNRERAAAGKGVAT